jgi:hypothetical protein
MSDLIQLENIQDAETNSRRNNMFRKMVEWLTAEQVRREVLLLVAVDQLEQPMYDGNVTVIRSFGLSDYVPSMGRK